MSVMIDKGGLKVDDRLVKLIHDEIAPGTGVDPENFWSGFGKLVIENAPRFSRLCCNPFAVFSVSAKLSRSNIQLQACSDNAKFLG